jgi:hypothetical protein
MSASEISNHLRMPFPVDVIEEKNGLLYVPHEIVRDRLIEATGNNFSWSIDQVMFRETSGEVRRANDRDTGEIVRPSVMIVIGTLDIPGLGKRAGIGVHPLDKGAGEDAAYKSAESDAVKRAAMAFGVGLQQLYIESGKPAAVRNSSYQSGGAPSAPRGGSSEPPQRASGGGAVSIANPDAPASDKQIKWVKDNLTKMGFDPDEDFELAGMTKGEASAWIEATNKGQLPDGVSNPKA